VAEAVAEIKAVVMEEGSGNRGGGDGGGSGKRGGGDNGGGGGDNDEKQNKNEDERMQKVNQKENAVVKYFIKDASRLTPELRMLYEDFLKKSFNYKTVTWDHMAMKFDHIFFFKDDVSILEKSWVLKKFQEERTLLFGTETDTQSSISNSPSVIRTNQIDTGGLHVVAFVKDDGTYTAHVLPCANKSLILLGEVVLNRKRERKRDRKRKKESGLV
jgi:hypothetical protein